MKHGLLAVFVLCWSCMAQAETAADLKKEVALLRAELESCRAAQHAPTPTPVPIAVEPQPMYENTPARKEAIAALRAVQSAIDAGASFLDFRKYRIEAAIKVDALPYTSENRAIKDASDTYGDVSVAWTCARIARSCDMDALRPALLRVGVTNIFASERALPMLIALAKKKVGELE